MHCLQYMDIIIGKNKVVMFKKVILAFVAAFACAIVSAQEEPARADGYKYVNASEFPVFGKVAEGTTYRYSRLPASLEGVSRKSVWNLGLNSAGVYVRFRTDAPALRVRWTSLNKHYMNHMSPTGDRGIDVYALTAKGWRFVKSGRPSREAVTDTQIIENMIPQMREFMVYMSLYDGVTDMEIAVPEGCILEGPALDSPSVKKPVIMYGTSILQGGCATRPGMAYTNIISRRLDREVINLGFSGNAKLDYEIAELMASVKDPGLFVLDYAPNCTSELIEEKGEKFFRILRDAHPDVPIIFVEQTPYSFMEFDQELRETLLKKMETQKQLFKKLKSQGEKKIYYIKGDKMVGTDGDAFVDGTHLTDLGMLRYADLVTPVIKKVLKKNK